MHLPRPVRPSDGGGNSIVRFTNPLAGGMGDETIFASNQSISKLLEGVGAQVISQNDDLRVGDDNLQLGIKTN